MSAYSDLIATYARWGVWRLGDVSSPLADASGNSRPLALSNLNPTYGVAGAITGDSDTAITCAGASQWSITSDPDAIRTLIVWINTTTNAAMPLIQTWFSGTADGFFGLRIISTGKVVGRAGGASGSDITSVTTVTDGNWHMVALVNTANVNRLYVDGVEEGSSTTQAIGTSADRFRLAYGRWTGIGLAYYTGSMDEAAALTDSLTDVQVAALYEAGTTLAINDPRDISGLVLWYSAEHEAANYTDGQSMTDWTDLSGNGNDATAVGTLAPQWEATTGPGSGPAVKFRGTHGTTSATWGYFSLPASVMGSATAGEILTQVKSDNADCSLWGLGVTAGSSAASHYPFSGTVYESFGTSARKTAFSTGSTAINVWRRYNVWSASNDYACRVDATSVYSTATNTVQWDAAPIIGHGKRSGGVSDNTGSFKGHMSAVILYNRKLSTQERDDLDAWLVANPNGGIAADPPTTATGSLSLSGAATAQSTGTATGSLSLSGTGNAVDASGTPASATGSLSLSGGGTVGQSRSATGSLTLSATGGAAQTIGSDEGQAGARIRGGYGTFFWTPPVVPLPVEPGAPPVPGVVEDSRVTAFAYGPVTLDSHFQPVMTASKATLPGTRQQIVVGGVDVSFFRGVATPPVSYTLLEPLLYGPASVSFPQISAVFEREGVGVLSWLKAGAPVEVNRVVDGVVVATDWKGFVAAFDKNGSSLNVELGGEANGRAAMRDRQVPIFPRYNDLGHQMSDAIRDLNLPHFPNLGAVTGIEQMTTGGTGHLDHINDLHAKAWTVDGGHWVTMPNEATGVYETHLKDTTTIHATAFLDDARTVGNLRRDIAEEPNQIFVTCVTPSGKRVRFGKYPGLVQGPPPPFPGFMEEGDTGEGVRLLVGKLHQSGYMKLVDVAGGYDDDVVEAVKDLQDDAGLPETGDVNLATWEALYDVNVTGFSLEWAQIQPAAQRSVTRKFDRSANGTIVGFNDEYDPDVIVRQRSIDLGSGVTRKQAREYARTELHDSDDPNWIGDISFNLGALLVGEVAIGATITEADVMYAEELRPGMNLWLPQFDGGTLVHVSACGVSDVVTATVDTRFRDAMEVWEVIARNKESRNDPARTRNRKARSSTIAKDSIGEWDEFAGMLGVDLELESGWNVFPCIAAMAGTVHRIKIRLNDDAEFACAVFGSQINAAWLDNLIPLPLTADGTKDWERPAIADALRDKLLNYAAGTVDEPCGYSPGKKSDGDDLTGVHRDDAGFSYFAANRTTVYVAVWVGAPNVMESQRVLEPQLEAGV